MTRKNIPWIVGIIFFILLAILIVNNRSKKERKFDQRITLQQKDKLPYGTSIARSLLPELFPSAQVTDDNSSPGNWDSLMPYSYNQALILVTSDFNADETELQRLLNFARLGNQVFIIAHSFSYDARRFFDFTNYMEEEVNFNQNITDTLNVHLDKNLFGTGASFSYPGYRYESSFAALDSSHCAVLGSNPDQRANFIRIKTGSGNIFIHTAPLAFSNYFLLYGNNISYFRHVFSVLPPDLKRIAWCEYYLLKPTRGQKEPNIFRVLMKYPAFSWGLGTAIFMLALLALLGSRRRQRMIPKYASPKNDSLDFVKTLGRLYYDRGDHQNLARKMSVYFLDHVRHTYKIPTQDLDENFVNMLHLKSGYGEKELGALVSFINYLGTQSRISEQQLAQFHRQLELFYQNT
jgi:hypothetical protein